ncbi:MAG: PDDEXK nuclease domain-containing protein [Bacteroidales bacterium]|nr:PDDEXK nuclease domain-containing protein [Bacteroidales bacterium]
MNDVNDKGNVIVSTNKGVLNDISSIIEEGRKKAYTTAGQTAIATFWNVGRRIVEEEQQGSERAKYGTELISELSNKLTLTYGNSYSKRNLQYYRKFYIQFPDFEKVNELVHNLSWTHIRRLLSVTNPEAQLWYMRNASEEMWSTTTLERNISTQYYERRLSEQRIHPDVSLPDAVAPYHDSDPLEYIKNPMVAEFMGFRKDTKFDESQLEQALIDNLQQFILELGKGFAFVDRQKHITTETCDFYIDLVFYNFKLKRFVIFELKTHPLTHQDVGQLDMYVRMYDDLMKGEDDNPTIGVLLCTETDRTIARYSVLHESEQLFAAKYMTYMPTEEELTAEIEKQKRFFLAQHGLN